VVLAVGGLYFLSVTEAFTVAAGDLIVMLCALLYAGHILVIDRFSPHLDGIHMSCIQFLAAAVISGVGMFAAERSSLPGIAMCLLPLLYAGLFSSAAGYTLQILAQKGADPTVVSILLSLESVFAVIGGALLLGERMGVRELLGCALMMAAVILAQLPGASGEQRQSGES
jgi:drug/metabolite transporter (DMT)-like permease